MDWDAAAAAGFSGVVFDQPSALFDHLWARGDPRVHTTWAWLGRIPVASACVWDAAAVHGMRELGPSELADVPAWLLPAPPPAPWWRQPGPLPAAIRLA